MRRSMATLLLVTATILGPAGTAAAAPTAGFSTSYQAITGDGGTTLHAFVVRPTGRGDGPFPLVVLPSSWGINDIEYVGAAAKLAYQSGYVVVSYTARGFWDSGGQIEVAGPEDVADASKVIDWALANTNADPSRIGMGGISYGAGISLLTAAADPRIRAVVSMSGWTDLAASLYPNETVSSQGVDLLLAAGHLTGRPGKDLQEAERDYLAGDFADVLPIAPPRSAATKIDAINRHGTAVMMANAWEDSLFPPSQLVDFYGKLTGPKRLMLTPGDHATPEVFGAAGLPNEVWDATDRWFDHYLLGVDNGIDREQPIQVKAANGGGWQGSDAWPWQQQTIPLPENSFHAGVDTVANSGTVFVSGILQGYLGIPTGVSVPLVSRSAAAVWSGPVAGKGFEVDGAPHARLAVTPSAADTTLFAYLYDVGPLGLGSLITHKPYSLLGATPGVARTIDLGLEPIAWNVPAGHHLALVVDTVDPRYLTSSKPGSTVALSGTLTVPVN
ncbi:CocE/NonD family hydrolase [Kutzneria kofuensis]|uniref:Putative acyl esterase n=1 Tax=Kutzneria kofuensis TaxID=103725 RepID=A0A7W9NH21_9PSEU|nr:CocE/NonD family hydrolase [Kutzneria kofuensis]MBB5891668.1 putative acyl esterase [Kutzneria kofuensis]